MERRTRKDIERRAQGLGLFVKTWSPGDGLTRYRFSREDLDYFAIPDAYAHTALGVKDADTWLDGYSRGFADGEHPHFRKAAV